MKYGKFILSFVIISLLLFSFSSALDEAWMMKRFPNWVPPLKKAENHSYCSLLLNQHITSNRGLDTVLIISRNYEEYYKSMNSNRKNIFYEKLPDDSLPISELEQLGDTLVITDGVQFYDVIIDRYDGQLGLQRIDSIPQMEDWHDLYLLFAKDSPTLKTIQPLVEVDIHNSTLETFLDSLKNSAKNKVLEIKHHYIQSSYLDSFYITFRAVASDSLPEIFFIYMDGYNLSGVAAYHIVIYCYKKNHEFAYLQLHESLYENTRYDIKCALNIDNDRYTDYFLKGNIEARIITIRRGQLNFVSGFMFDMD